MPAMSQHFLGPRHQSWCAGTYVHGSASVSYVKQSPINPLELVRLTPLMALAAGRAEITIGLIDGPVATNHPDLAAGNIRELPGRTNGRCTQARASACLHGTLVAGILSAKRSSAAPAICPNCTLLARPIFAEATPANEHMPSATPDELATAVVAAAGNQGAVGSSGISRHLWIIPVVAWDLLGEPISYSNLGNSTGDAIASLGGDGKPFIRGGTSAATPFVTGAIALFQTNAGRRRSVLPPITGRLGGISVHGECWFDEVNC